MDDDIHSALYLLNVLFINYIIYLTAHTRVGWCQVPETKGDKNPVDNEGVVYRWRQLQGSVRAVWLQWPGHGDAETWSSTSPTSSTWSPASSSSDSDTSSWSISYLFRGENITGDDIYKIFEYEIFSNFPHDIIEEISQISFSNFNSKNGSYQKLIPSVAHHFLFQQAVFRSDY